MRALLTGLALVAMAGSTFAATRKVPQQYDTIQEAVDAAEAGDTIKIAPGTYHENVSFEGKDGLKFVGKKVTWDGNIEGYQSHCVSASSNNLLFSGIFFRNGNPHLSISGNDVTVQKCTFQNGWSWCVNLEGSNFRFLKNTVQGSDNGITISTEDAVIEKNVFRTVYGAHAQVYGDRTKYNGNRNGGFYEDGSAVFLEGDEVVATKNTLKNNYGNGIRIEGNEAFVQKNTFLNNYTGLRLDGNGGTVDANTFRSGYYYLLYIDGNDNGITKNRLSASYYSCVYMTGTANVLAGNSISDTTSDWAIQNYGHDVRIEDNEIDLCYEGIYSAGGTPSISGNRVTDVWSGEGIYVDAGESDGGGTIEGNVVTDVTDDGIYVNSTGHTLASNTVVRSSTSYYAAFYVGGTNHILESNTAIDAGDDGFYVTGSGHTLNGCVSRNAAINGFRIVGSTITLDGCEATGSGGQGFRNSGPSTTVTDSTFLDNALDVANSGTLVGGTGGMTFDTGGESQSPWYFNND